ncbi:molybdenum cofactor biosynthesis protein [Alkalibaculum sp. M08DMB]|uniref:Molybdenum cofactor biosynthesis protein B n=1 Tax=Alkalibaculum sporogenes TaxID=2655001 RepID=A0A6A7KBL6_9FIRM|nr:MogA/MoaB family molybdenum cofactor biosynthesis protein [Alkalibaculum sporogenes]MPW26661.1 molybdenum cofactor biosynthesis protein [Alkalibaculum sporogenes]
MIKVGILTASDKGHKGEREDKSGKVIQDRVKEISGIVSEYVIVPDERDSISSTLISMADKSQLDLILTTGGTGFSPRDITPEATKDVIEREVPGIPEAIRAKSMEITNRAMLSRATAGIRGKTLIINMPGSPKAVNESLDIILPVLIHAIEILIGQTGECAR